MRAFAAVFFRELEERRLLLGGGLLLGLLPLAVPLVPGPLAVQAPQEVREAAALALFWISSLAFAVLMGASVFGTDLAERRLSFYFSRPLPSWSLWAGKLSAAIGLVLAAGALVLLPTAAVGQRLPRTELLWAGPRWSSVVLTFWFWPVLVVLLIAVAHAARTTVLTRSAWRLADLVGLLVAAGAVRWIWGRLLDDWAVGALKLVTGFLEVALIVGLFLAWALQIARGRTALRRGYRTLSLTLWAVLLSAIAVAGGYSSWVLGAEPDDLERVSFVRPVTSGDWTILAGKARGRAGYHPAFLYRISDGEFTRLPAGDPLLAETIGRALPASSGDGKRAYWLASPGQGIGPPFELIRMSLDVGEGLGARTSIPLARSSAAALSEDGTLLAELAGRRLTVEDIDGHRLLASLRLPAEVADSRIRFEADPNRLLLFRTECESGCRLIVRRVEVTTGELTELLRVEGWPSWTLDPSRRRLLVIHHSHEAGSRYHVRLADLATGTVREIAPAASDHGWVGHFLADGRILAQDAGDGGLGSPWVPHRPEFGSRLWLIDRDGVPLRPLQVGAGRVRVGSQPGADRLLIALAPGSDRPTVGAGSWRTYLVDLESGEARPVGERLLPAAGPEIGPASLGSRLLLGAAGELLLLDPETLDLKRVLPRV